MYGDVQPVFVATLGQRPQALTMALDYLLPRYPYLSIDILHTDPEHSGIRDSYHALMDCLSRDYENLPINSRLLQFTTGDPIVDIEDMRSAEAYYLAVAEILRHYRMQNILVHLLIAGGRKAMSIYATLAATRILGEHDRVWTILTPTDLIQAGLFHIPPGRFQDVQVVNLPVKPSKLLPGVLAGRSTKDIIAADMTPRMRFLKELSKQENAVIEVLRQNPYASTAEMGLQLNKATKTVENQLRSIYIKLSGYYDLDVPRSRKRQVLLDVINERV